MARMDDAEMKSRTRFRRRTLATIIVVILFAIIAVPYAIARLRSHATAVSIEVNTEHVGRAAFERTIRVGCFNIAHGRGAVPSGSNWDGGTRDERLARLRSVSDFLNEHQLDIVVLNEVDFDAVWSDGIDQASVIAAAAEYPYVVRQRNYDVKVPFAALRFGNVILSRFPVRDAELVQFSANSGWERIVAGGHDAVLATIAISDDAAIDVLALHLESRSRSVRKAAAGRIQTLLDERTNPVLVMGDLNSQLRAVPHREGDRPTAIELILEDRDFSLAPDSPPGTARTFPSDDPTVGIDWILVPHPWSVVKSEVVATSLSDHLPVVAEITLPGDEDASSSS